LVMKWAGLPNSHFDPWLFFFLGSSVSAFWRICRPSLQHLFFFPPFPESPPTGHIFFSPLVTGDRFFFFLPAKMSKLFLYMGRRGHSSSFALDSLPSVFLRMEGPVLSWGAISFFFDVELRFFPFPKDQVPPFLDVPPGFVICRSFFFSPLSSATEFITTFFLLLTALG